MPDRAFSIDAMTHQLDGLQAAVAHAVPIFKSLKFMDFYYSKA